MGSLVQIANLEKNWISGNFQNHGKFGILGKLGNPGTLEPWEPCGSLRNLRELLEPAGIRNPAETSGTQEPCGTLGFLRRAFE